MTAAATPAVDLLSQVIERARPQIADPEATPRQRLQRLWAYARASRDLAASDVLLAEFRQLAIDAGLDRHPLIRRDGIDHVLRWAWLDRDPFGSDQ
jgi:hypothetical protein